MRITIPAIIFVATTQLSAGYDLHITRKAFWADKKGPRIRRNEWTSLVKADKQIRKDPQNGPNDYLVLIPGEEFPLWFDPKVGGIYTKNPSKAAIKKLIEIAQKLHAKVQGDDGELYPSAP